MIEDLDYYDKYTLRQLQIKLSNANLIIRLCEALCEKDEKVILILKGQRSIILKAIERQQEKQKKIEPVVIALKTVQLSAK